MSLRVMESAMRLADWGESGPISRLRWRCNQSLPALRVCG